MTGSRRKSPRFTRRWRFTANTTNPALAVGVRFSAFATRTTRRITARDARRAAGSWPIAGFGAASSSRSTSSTLRCDAAAALAIAAHTLAAWRDRVELVHSDYRSFRAVLDQRGVARVDGALADLGMSSLQLEAEGRGKPTVHYRQRDWNGGIPQARIAAVSCRIIP